MIKRLTITQAVFTLAISAAGLIGCSRQADEPARPPAAPEELIDAAIAGDHRSEAERARDQYRHPKQTLMFFGLEPDMTVVEVWPGGGWYTQIIAPALKEGGGLYYAAGFAREGASPSVLDALNSFEKSYVQRPEIYGAVVMSETGENVAIAPPGTADMVLTFRNVHNWMQSGRTEKMFEEFYKALKPGGVLGVVEHRADGADLPRDGSSGYVYSEDVIAIAQKAGFDFEASSEINANAIDTKDHPFGVWTLPPVRRSSAVSGAVNSDFERAAYDAIGESDRMTLKFRKPIAASGALLE